MAFNVIFSQLQDKDTVNNGGLKFATLYFQEILVKLKQTRKVSSEPNA